MKRGVGPISTVKHFEMLDIGELTLLLLRYHCHYQLSSCFLSQWVDYWNWHIQSQFAVVVDNPQRLRRNVRIYKQKMNLKERKAENIGGGDQLQINVLFLCLGKAGNDLEHLLCNQAGDNF